jgi:branched-chain amino acid transport system permease protein
LTALTVAQALAAMGLPPPLVLALAAIAAIAVCSALGVSIERAAYRPLRRAPRLAPLITAIGVSVLLQYSAALVWGKQYLSMPQLVKPSEIALGGIHLTDMQAFIFLLACAVMAGLLWFIHSTRAGRAMRATEQNPDVAGLMGVNVNHVIALTFLVGSAIGAIAGMMVVLYYGIGHYFMGFMLGLKAFTAAVLGGIGNVAGAMVGGMLLGVVESLATGYIGDLTGGVLGSNYRDIFAFLVLILVLVFRPSGLLGERVADRT